MARLPGLPRFGHVLAVLAAALMWPLPASAGTTVIDFNAPTVPLGATAVEGATFEGGWTVAAAPSPAQTGDQVLACDVETCDSALTIVFPSPQQWVEVDVGAVSGPGSSTHVTLSAGGVSEAPTTLQPSDTSTPVTTPLVISASDNSISSVTISAGPDESNAGLAIDNLTFGAVPVVQSSPPDLHVSAVRGQVSGNHLIVRASVSNHGAGAAPPATATARVRGWTTAEATVPPLDQGGSTPTPLVFVLAIPRRAHGTTVHVRVCVPAQPGTASVLQRCGPGSVRIPAVQPPPQPESGVDVIWVIGTGLAGLLGGTLAGAYRLRRCRRRTWQARSKRRPSGRCVPPQRECVRECKIDYAARRITEITIVGRDRADADSTRALTLTTGPVEHLDDARREYRAGGAASVVDGLLARVTDELAAALATWQPELPSRPDISISVRLEGGDCDCTFTLKHCVIRDGECEWQDEAQWTATLKDDAEVSVITMPAVNPMLSQDAREQLLRQLRRLIETE